MKKQRLLSLVLAVVMVVGLIPSLLPAFTIEAEAAAATGTAKTNASGSADRWIKQDTYWDTKEPVDEVPLTFEAVIRHKNVNPKKGVWLSNYVDNKTPSISFYVTAYGRPEVCIIDGNGTKKTYNFGNQSTKTYEDEGKTVTLKQCLPFADSTYLHVAFTIDPVNDIIKYYQNGVLYGVVTSAVTDDLSACIARPMRIGGDYRTDNTEYWTGAMHYVAIYNRTFTTSEIRARYNAGTWAQEDDSLIAAWDLSRQNSTIDRSGNGHDLIYTKGEGIRIDTFGSYTIDKSLEGIPSTVEAWLWMPTCYNTRGGTFIGNYTGKSSGSYFAFEIQNSGHPRYFFRNSDGTNGLTIFDKVDIRNNAWTHVAIVHDPKAVVTVDGVEITGAAFCYVNGVLAQTCAFTKTVLDKDNKTYQTPIIPMDDTVMENYVHFGGDRQGAGMTQRFNGYIKEMRVYSDQRTAEEIASDYAGNVDYTDDNIVLHYDLRNVEEYTSFEDLSGNGHNVTYNQTWYDEAVMAKDYAYSLALVGDTQTVTYSNPDKLKNIYQWIIDNKEAKNIQYVIGLGDITEKGEDWGHKNNDTEEETAVGDAEWTAAKEAITMMDGIIPYSLIRGAGHDGIERFNQYFGNHQGYLDNIAGFMEEGRIDNVYHTFTVGDTKYMILCLDFGTKDPAIEWANEVIAAHPDYRVIITTHAYLEKDGSLLETGEAYCPSQSYYDPTNNDGDDLWNKLVRKHANIAMVLCGHMTCDGVVRSTQVGDHGNIVQQILVDPQSGLDTSSSPRGMVAMLYFSEDGSDVQVEYYSTITDMYRPSTRFEMPIGSTEKPSYEELPEGYLIAQNSTTGRYIVVKDYVEFLGGSLRYGDAVDGEANLRFGYRFASDFDLDASAWKWNWGLAGEEKSEKLGSVKTTANISNLVITGIPEEYYKSNFEVELVFNVTLDGVTYTVTDRVRVRSIYQIATGMAKNPAETEAARDYAQSILDACKPAA